MKNPFLAVVFAVGLLVLAGCETMYNMADSLNKAHTYDSSAMVGGGAVAGKDYITGLAPCEDARAYFSKSSSIQTAKVEVHPGDDKGTGVEWTDDGGIVIPPGATIEFVNKGYCMDPHLPAPKTGEEIQFVKASSLLPKKMHGTYKNLMQRAAAGDDEIKNNMQRLVWALRTAGTDDAMATHLTERQQKILEENASNEYEGIDSFDGLFDKLLADAKQQLAQAVAEMTSVRIGNVTYNAFDLMDPDKGIEKVAVHMDALVAMSRRLPVIKAGFNYGQIGSGIYTDVRGGISGAPVNGDGWLTFTAKIANSTAQLYTFYPLDYVGQVGCGNNSSAGIFYATSPTSMRQRITMGVPNTVIAQVDRSQQRIENPPAIDNARTIQSASPFADLNRQEQLNMYIGGKLAEAAYRNNDGTAIAAPDGFRVLTQDEFDSYIGSRNRWFGNIGIDGAGYMESQDGFAVRLFVNKKDNSLVVAYRGSSEGMLDAVNPLSSGDGYANTKQNGGGLPAQYLEASLLLKTLIASYDGKIRVVGHSLGGGLTQYALATNDLDGRVVGQAYNSAGLSRGVLETLDRDKAADAAGSITMIRSTKDPVSRTGDGHLGFIYDVPNGGLHGIGALINGMGKQITGF